MAFIVLNKQISEQFLKSSIVKGGGEKMDLKR